MANLNDLDDVTISNPKVGDVVKYTAQGWANGADATGGGTGGNPCGSMDDFTQTDVKQTITEPWTWSIEDGEYVRVEHQAGVNNLNEFTNVYPGRLLLGNKNGSVELKAYDGGNSRLTAFQDQLEFYDVNNPDGVTLSELVACCDGTGSGGGSVTGTNSVAMVNFPAAGVYEHEQGTTAQSAWTPVQEGGNDPFSDRWYNRTFYDIFDADNNSQVVEMPPGTNAAVLLLTYPVTITATSLVQNYSQGYVNVAYNMEVTDNKGSAVLSPGPLAAPVKIRTEIMGWVDAGLIGGGDPVLQTKRTPGSSSTGSKYIRMSFTQSTADNPTRLTLKPRCTINRTRACKSIISSGRVVVLPYYDDGSGFQPTQFAIFDESIFEDDSGAEIAFEQANEAHDLKELMNYYTNAIRETLDYDQNLAEEGKPILTQALKDIFGLKQEQVDDINYYYDRLSTIRSLVLPYVGFRFGFETEATTLSF